MTAVTRPRGPASTPPATPDLVASKRAPLIEGALFVALYVTLDLAGRVLLGHWSAGLPWYPPAGLAIAFVVVRGTAALPWLLVARIALSASVLTGVGAVPVILNAVAGAAVTLALSTLFRRLPRPSRDGVAAWRIGDVATFFALSLLAGASYGGVAALLAAGEGVRQGTGYVAFALQYGIGDAIGIAVVVPIVLLLWPVRSERLTGHGALWLRATVFGALTGAAVQLLEHATGVRIAYLGLLPLGWAAVRGGVSGAAIAAGALDAAITIAWSVDAASHAPMSLVELQAFMLIATMGALLLGATASALDAELAQRRDAEQRLRAVVDQSVAGFFTIVGDRFAYVNAHFASMLGYTVDELRAVPSVRAMLVPEDRARIAAEVAQRVREGNAAAQYIARIVRKDGSHAVVEAHSTFTDVGGRHGIVGAAIDRTALSATEAALRERDEQLRQAQKLEAIGLLAGGVAHDFNNMLTAIGANVSLALTESASSGDPWPAVRDALHEIRGASGRAADLTRQLLAFGRKQVLHPEAVALDAVVVAALPLLRRVAGEDIRVDARLDPGAGTVVVDPMQIEQVLLNLVVNARDAMRGAPDKRLLVATFAHDVADGTTPNGRVGLEPGRYAVLAVSDRGAGMDDVTRARIFEPFFTTKPIGEGTGLGLATVFGIVKQSGGSIFVDTAPGHGATFSVYLPRSDERPALPNDVPAPATPVSSTNAAATPDRRASLLVVEDEAVVRRVVQRILANAGYHVLEATDPTDALRRWPDIGADVRLVVADMVMPDMDGLQLAAALRAERPDLPVLLMSGYSEALVTANGPLPAGTVWIGKPFTTQQLRDAVAAML